MMRLPSDPRVRVLLLILVVLLGLALVWHLAGEHGGTLGACVAILVALALLVAPLPEVWGRLLQLVAVVIRTPETLIPLTGRPPPDAGTILRL